MKRTLLAALAVGMLLVVSAPTLSAQGVRWGVNAGVLMPLGDYNTFDKPGWIVGGGATYWLTGGTLGVRGDASYGQTKHDGGIGGDTKIAGGMASLVYGLGSSAASMRPFVTGGLGFYNVKIETTGPGASSFSETKIAFGAGAGVMLKLGTGGMRAVVATRFTSVSTSGSSTTFLPITVGLTFGR
jgi:opacity protein-like surface antigen